MGGTRSQPPNNPIIHSFYCPTIQFFVEIAELAQVLTALGCPAEKSGDMAAQLDKRARQLAAEKGRSHDEALRHLLELMRQGWAAKEKGL